ncbi:hypothetical protein HYH02_002276 [Chlamydomonas schloesseri]|uniref:AAA+ ATPase domain-containing protein n=1 Tax=Chlamydomonas schloesseri TaxID=2026947 RepID=A0A835WRR5_9CHLO|nr:hypothetical protein HYH02_002276 [Chlamydomonas schloesseri]|eukprot:KAG2452939.1 hypothetical protein HYH02_002276 [Chlamydomonas schloesseri]
MEAELSLPGHAVGEGGDGAATQQQPAPLSQSQPMRLGGAADDEDDFEDHKVPVSVEVCLRENSVCSHRQVAEALARYLEGRTLWYRNGPLDLCDSEDPLLLQQVAAAAICDADPRLHRLHSPLLFWQYTPRIYVYQLSDEGPADDDEGEEGVPSYRELLLPALDLAGQWEALQFDSAIQQRLLSYATSALLFADRGVDGNLVSWNRVVLLYGPPGTGKTSLCKALAHKLSIRLGGRYRQGCLVEVNAHSLFSKFFSESGKLVSRLFAKITELVEEPDVLVFVLIDEVESLTSARKAAVAGSEPSDAIRAVNALLTQLDALRRFPNVMVLTTSNITQAIDVAFVDRADIKAYIGPPTLAARYEMLRASIQELSRAGVIAVDVALLAAGCRAAACVDDTRRLLLPYHEAAAAAAASLAAQGAAGVFGCSNGSSNGSSFGGSHARGAAASGAAGGGGDGGGSSSHEQLLTNGGAALAAAVAGASFLPLPPPGLAPEQAAAAVLSLQLLQAAAGCEGLSGRTLRKLPFLAHAGSPALVQQHSAAAAGPTASGPGDGGSRGVDGGGSAVGPGGGGGGGCSARAFLEALREAAEREQSDRSQLLSG